jgi:hypothetical protein
MKTALDRMNRDLRLPIDSYHDEILTDGTNSECSVTVASDSDFECENDEESKSKRLEREQ